MLKVSSRRRKGRLLSCRICGIVIGKSVRAYKALVLYTRFHRILGGKNNAKEVYQSKLLCAGKDINEMPHPAGKNGIQRPSHLLSNTSIKLEF